MSLDRSLVGWWIALVVFASAPAASGAVTLKDVGEGYIAQDNSNDGVAVSNYYLAGNCGDNDCYVGEYRNFFEFKIPVSAVPYTSAKLVINTGDVLDYQPGNPLPTYTVTSLSSRTFNGLGTGTVYGSRTYSYKDYFKNRTITLDAAALAAIGKGGKAFDVGGRITSNVFFNPLQPDLLAFGYVHGPVMLVLSTAAPGAAMASAIPEPTSWAMMLAGLSGLGAMLRRRASGALPA